MKNAAAFRITIHVCLFFAFTAIIPPLMVENYLCYYAIVGLILLASLFAVYAKSIALRIPIVLIPFAGLLLVPKTPVALIVGALPCIYAAAQMISAKFFFEEWLFRREMKTVCIIIGAIFAFFAVFTLMLNMLSADPREAEAMVKRDIRYESVVFLIAALLLVVLALRCIRAGNIKSARWQIGNAGFFVMPLAFAVAAGIGLTALTRSIDFKTPIESLAMRISSCSTKELEPEPSRTPIPRDQNPIQAHSWLFFEEEEYDNDLTTEKPNKRGVKIAGKELPLIAIAAAGAVLAAVLITVLIRKGRRVGSEDLLADDTERVEDESLMTRILKGNRRSKKAFGNAERIREIYRRYITFLKMRGITPSVSTTSEELSERSRALLLDEQPDELLRALYLRARYEGAELTDEEVLLAGQAFDRIVEKSNIREESKDQ